MLVSQTSLYDHISFVMCKEHAEERVSLKKNYHQPIDPFAPSTRYIHAKLSASLFHCSFFLGIVSSWKMEASLQSTEGVIEEIMRIHRSLPARPSTEEVEASRTLIKNVEREEQARLETISKERKGIGVNEELFSMLQDMQSNVVAFRSREERRKADRLMDLERFHARFDEYLQRASKFIPGAKTCEPVSHSNGYISGGAVVKNSAVTGSKAAGVDQSSTLSIVSAGFDLKIKGMLE